MAYNGVEIISIGIKHTVANITLYPKGGETATLDIGGLMTDDDTAGITGSGEAIYKMTQKRWKVEVPPVAWDRGTVNTLLELKSIVESYEEASFTFELADGNIYKGKGRIVGELKGAALDANIPIIFSGGGKLEKI